MPTFSLTDQQLRTLRAAADRIIPPDSTPGAAEAGAAEFIVGLLNRELCGEQSTYIEGLNGIESEALATYDRPFASLTSAEQDAVLTTIEQERVKTIWLVSPTGFFQLLVENVLEGFYADPANGGNRDAVSWKMVGFRAEGGTW